MRSTLEPVEKTLAWAAAGFIAVAFLGPAAQETSQVHMAADQRSVFGLRHGVDVLSNALIAVMGYVGLRSLATAPPSMLRNVPRAMARLFFWGLVLLSIGSAAYHLDPSSSMQAVERYCTVPLLAGMLGLCAADHVSGRAGAACGMTALGLGLLAVKYAALSGDVLPWRIFQVASVVLVWWMATLSMDLRSLGVQWPLVLLAGGASRAAQHADQMIFDLTQGLLSGQTVQHAIVALAAWPVLRALRAEIAAHRTAREPGPAPDVVIRWCSRT